MKRLIFVFILLILYSIKISAAVTLLNVNQQKNNTAFLIKKDTTAIIVAFIKKADVYKNKGLYALAYENLWNGQLLAEVVNDIENLAIIHKELGVLYSIYGKVEKAIKHKEIHLKLVKTSINYERNTLIEAYYSLAVQYRKIKNYDKSLLYLDSCVLMNRNKNLAFTENQFVLAEKGNIYLLKNNLQLAETLLLKAKNKMEINKKNYLVVLYSFLGDLYAKKKQYKKALSYFTKSLNLMSVNQSHTDIKTDVLKKTAAIYKEQKNFKKAYFYLEESKKIADSLFSTRNKNNGNLFEIKNQYQETILKKEAHIVNQKQIIAQKKREQWQLTTALFFVIFISAAIFFIFYNQSKIRKLKSAKEKTELKVLHEKEKSKINVEAKCKELTVSALKLIEKDKIIEKILNILKENAPEAYSKVQKNIKIGNKMLWKNFNLRFTELNTDFYRRLLEKHQNLTVTEQKHCALIKLKFDSKEMASILNISISSVHISRHRIRKKMELKREEDLSNYIANI